MALSVQRPRRIGRRLGRQPRASVVHDRLVEGLGREQAQRVLDVLGPGRIVRLPYRLHETRAERRQRCLEALKTETYRDAAKLVGCSTSTLFEEAERPD